MAIGRFLKSKDGNFAMMLAATLPVIFGGVGLAVDVSTMLSAKAKLQSSLDAAVLAASHLKDSSLSRQQLFDDFLRVNLAAHPEFDNVSGVLTVEAGATHIATRGEVTADVKLRLMQYFGSASRIGATAAAYESSIALEIAMVLDNTGSMGTSRMQSLREASRALSDILKEMATVRTVKAALVPFVTAVNVKGEGYSAGWIDTEGKATYHGANFELRPDGKPYNHLDLFKKLSPASNPDLITWKGCVEARPSPYNLDDTAPTSGTPNTLFVPYFAPDNPGAAAMSPNLGDKWNNSYLTDTATDSTNQRKIARYLDISTPRYIVETAPRSTGPNYACPTPIVPLTDDFEKLNTAIAAMRHWEGSGTNVSEGLAWGMRVLSPGEPYTQGAAFDDDTVSKAVVVFTDGENTVFGASSQTFNKSDYGAYSFIDSNRMGSTVRATALTNVNTWTQTMCTRLKNNGVRVFTVLLGADTAANRALYSACASTPADYYPTTDVSNLKSVFEKIGVAVAGLYLTH